MNAWGAVFFNTASAFAAAAADLRNNSAVDGAGSGARGIGVGARGGAWTGEGAVGACGGVVGASGAGAPVTLAMGSLRVILRSTSAR